MQDMKIEPVTIATMKNQLDKVQEFLDDSINDGWYPYSFTGTTPSTEASAWAAIAMAQSHPQLTKKLITFLLANQNSDGGWSTGPGIGTSDWTSALAVLALRLVKHYQPDLIAGKIFKRSLKNAIHYLIMSRNDYMFPVLRLLLLLGAKGPMGLQFGKGWPWNRNCYSWIEPTAYSLMALKLPYPIDDYLTKVAVSHANTFMLDRTCKGGGWNHGAYYCLGEHCPAYTLTTAEALLALVDMPENEQVKSGWHFLQEQQSQLGRHYIRSNGKEGLTSAWSLSSSILALDAYGLDCTQSLNWLAAFQNKNGSFGSNYMVTALAVLALNTTIGTNPFKITRG
jgi:hypothetical protein